MKIYEVNWKLFWEYFLQFPNAVVLNAAGRRNTQMRANERKWAQKSATQVRKRAQKGAKERKRAQKGVKIANNQV